MPLPMLALDLQFWLLNLGYYSHYTGTLQKLIVGSNANNGSKASLSNFNSNNGVSNANSNVSYLYFQIRLF